MWWTWVIGKLRSGIGFSLAIDDVTDKACYETQNHFASRVTPSDPALSRIHVTPDHPIVIPLGLTFHLRPKRQLALPSGTKSLCFSATGPDLSAAVWEGQTFFRS